MLKKNISFVGLVFGILVFLFFLVSSPPEGLSKLAWLTAGVTILMTIWWISEAIPIYATGFIPIILFPLLGLFELKIVASSYAHPLVLLFLGGFIIASAMEGCGLHKRIALKILSLAGTSPSKIIAGFMFTTALLSMWVSNTASTIMMLPIATSVIAFFSRQKNIENNRFSKPLLLSIAYSASIGGAATLIGTPTNIMLASILSDTYNYEISFIDWFIVGLPVTLVLIPLVWFFLNKIIFKVPSDNSRALETTLFKMKKEMGTATLKEKIAVSYTHLTLPTSFLV